jgi:hypothetical protein
MSRPVPAAAAVLLLAVLAACAPGEAADPHGAPATASAGPIETPSAGGPPPHVGPDTAPPLQPGWLAAVTGQVVEGRTGPGGRPFEVASRTPGPPGVHARRYGTVSLDIALRLRTPELRQYPCTACHVGAGLTPGTDRVADAHQDIQPVHPSATGATCATCHSPRDVERLAFDGSVETDLDQAHRLCARCHFAQVDAWAGGGHGKRLDGWDGRRVVMACADCHDPHQPALERRIPFRPPTLQRPGSRSP